MNHWYNKYIGFDFKHLGEKPDTGIDCFNLCRYVYKQEKEIEIPLATSFFCNIAEEDWYQKTTDQLFENGSKLSMSDFNWKKVSIPKPFDIVLMSLGSTNVTNHCALFVEPDKILQITVGRKSWISGYGSYYKQYSTGIYRWNV